MDCRKIILLGEMRINDVIDKVYLKFLLKGPEPFIEYRK